MLIFSLLGLYEIIESQTTLKIYRISRFSLKVNIRILNVWTHGINGISKNDFAINLCFCKNNFFHKLDFFHIAFVCFYK